jgi:three-Cys-motif partner protein
MDSTDEKYWADYDGLQLSKHNLLRKYLGGWFPILASFKGKVLYIDCHAGRGRHDTGQEGSPVLAIKLLLDHSYRNSILATTEVNFILFEIDKQNYDLLCEELNKLGKLPPKINVIPIQADYADALRQIIEDSRKKGKLIAPFFAFVDPYTFTLSMDLLNDLLGFPHCELLINFMYRFVDMAMTRPSQAANMDSLFGCPNWRGLTKIKDPQIRANKTIELFSAQLRAQYVTHMYMRAKNGALKYVLIHATNHSRGREVMKDALWSLTPDGSFTASERDSVDQPILITLDPDLSPLENALWRDFAGKSVDMAGLYNWLLSQTYVKKHLHQILSEYRKKGIVGCEEYGDRFAFKRNPIFLFPPKRSTT